MKNLTNPLKQKLISKYTAPESSQPTTRGRYKRSFKQSKIQQETRNFKKILFFNSSIHGSDSVWLSYIFLKFKKFNS